MLLRDIIPPSVKNTATKQKKKYADIEKALAFFTILFLILQFFAGLEFLYPKQAKATGDTYYVDNTITNTNVGSCTPDLTTYNYSTYETAGGTDSAFATIADINACNSTQLPAGSKIYFRKGQTWREQLNPPSSGSSGNLISFGAYGSGDKPIINGADLVSTWTAGTAQDEGGNRVWDDFEYSAITDKWSGSSITSGNSITLDTTTFYAGAKSLKTTFASTAGSDSAYLAMSNLGDINTTLGAGMQAAQSDFYVTFRFRYDITSAWLASNAYYKNKIMLVKPYASGGHAWLNTTALSLNMDPDGSLFYSVNGSSQVDTTYDITASTWVQIKVRFQMPNATTNGSTITIWVNGDQKATANFTGWHSNVELLWLGGGSMRTQAGNNFSFNYDNYSLSTFDPRTVTPYSASVGWDAPATNAMTAMADGTPLFMVNGTGGLHRDSFYFDDTANTAYIILSSGDDPDSHTIEIGRRRYNINACQKNYLTFENLDLRNAGEANIYENQSTNWTLDGLDIKNAQRRGLMIDDPGTLLNYYTTLSDSTISYISWGNIMSMAAGIYGDNVGELTFTRNTFDHIGEHAIRLDGQGDNIEISSSTFHDLGSSAADGPAGANTVIFENNEVYNASLYDIKGGVGSIGTVRYNLIHDNWGYGGMKIGGNNNAEIYYNIFYNNHGFDLTESNAATGVAVYNNTFGSLIGDETGGTVGYSVGVALAGSTGWNIKNNIGRYLRFTTNAPTVNYNDWYRASSVDVVNSNGTLYGNTNAFSGWATGDHANEINSDPAYVNSAIYNFKILTSSPAKNAGTNVSLAQDYLGTVVPQGPAQDIGAYEYVSGGVDITPPTAPTGVAVN